MTHIPFRQLVDYAYNRLPDRQSCQQIMTHVNECPECRQTLAIAWQVAHAAGHHTPEEPSPALLGRVLKATYRKQRRLTARNDLPHFPAALIHDSKVVAVTAGVRGSSCERELLFSFGRLDLHLSLVKLENNESYTLLGQLLDTEPHLSDLEGSQVDLLQDQLPLRTILTDHLGCFRMSNLRGGEYGLRITAETGTSTIESLSLHA